MFDLLSIALFFSTIILMEPITWFVHKYVMHGFLWVLHKDHHNHSGEERVFEKNDIFALFFSIPPALLIYGGLQNNLPLLASAGFGVTLYGIAYFILHDMVFHKRYGLHIKPRGRYMKRLTKGHIAHHLNPGKDNDVSCGFLYANKKFDVA